VVMRPPAGIPTISKRAKRVLVVIGALIVLAVLWFQFVGIYVDWLWYGEVKLQSVFTTQLVTRVVLFLIAGLGAAGAVLLALLLAFRSRPVFVPSGEVDPLSPYRTIVSSRPRLFALAISILVGLVCGLSAQSSWQTVQLFLHAQPFNKTDPQFGHDIGFYVFTLPFLQMLISWLFAAVALAFFAVLITQYLYGGLRLAGAGRRISSQAALQLSLLVGAFVLVKAIQYWFDRYELLFSNRNSAFTGASYTDVNAVLPAKIILMVIAAICAVGFFVGAFLKSVKLPGIALALLVLSSVLIGGVWPLVLQQVVVTPNGISKEPPYISRNLVATKDAYSIDPAHVKYEKYAGNVTGSTNEVINDQQTVPNARLLDPNVLSPTFTQQRQLRNWYGFPNQLSIDRYALDGGKTQDYVVAARELNGAGLLANQNDWIQRHLVYTHGDGLIAAPANKVVEGYPAYIDADVAHPKNPFGLTQPRIYYGSLATDYAVVGSENASTQLEQDTDGSYTYAGLGGVHVGNLFKRLVFATNYGEANFLFSSNINGKSKILYNRDPRTRVSLAAPFLTTDTKPYPAVVAGRMVWIVDAYTTVANYPYSENVNLANETNNSLIGRGAAAQNNTTVSYIRNSVKATVDAYDGTVTLYAVDDKDPDPVLRAWEGVFPGLIQPTSSVTAELRSHFRYPEDLFEVQRSLMVKYNVTDPTAFFTNAGFWKVPFDPTISDTTASQPPYYLQVRLPGKTDSSFQLTSVLTRFGKEYMSAYVAAASDPANYGQLTVLTLPIDTQTLGPTQVQNLFRTTNEIASLVTLSQQSGQSRVIFGNLLTLPVADALLYVEPLYVQTTNQSNYPKLNKILVWFKGQVGVGNSLAEALLNAQPRNAPDNGTDATNPSGVSGSPSASVSITSSTGTPIVVPSNQQQAVAELRAAVNDLNSAKKSGDLVKIATATQRLQNAVDGYLQQAAPSSAVPNSAPPVSAPRSGG